MHEKVIWWWCERCSIFISSREAGELCPSVYYMSAGAIVLWRPLELLRPPFRGYARRLFLGGHKIEEMLFRTFVFASVLNDAQSLLSSLKPANSGRLYANADSFFFFASLDLDLFSFCSARSSQMKESVSMGQIDTAKGKKTYPNWIFIQASMFGNCQIASLYT